jgi:hypothetical protein
MRRKLLYRWLRLFTFQQTSDSVWIYQEGHGGRERLQYRRILAGSGLVARSIVSFNNYKNMGG